MGRLTKEASEAQRDREFATAAGLATAKERKTATDRAKKNFESREFDRRNPDRRSSSERFARVYKKHPVQVPALNHPSIIMPGLTVNTNNTSAAQSPTPNTSTNRNSASSSPVAPPYSPISPSRSAAAPQHPQHPQHDHNGIPYTYTHHQQQRQASMRPPAPVAIDYATNPDVLAVSAAQSILLLQQRKAKEDLVKLSMAKMRASNEPWEFQAALKAGDIRHENNSLLDPSAEEYEEEDDEEGEYGELAGASASHQTGYQQQHTSPPTGLGMVGGDAAGSGSGGFNFGGGGSGGAAGGFAGFGSGGGQAFTSGGEPVPSGPGSGTTEGFGSSNGEFVGNNILNATTSSPHPASSSTKKSWAPLPSPQNVYHVPPINWFQYGIIGEPLQGLHDHAVRRPTEGAPAVYNPTDGTYTFPPEVNKRQSDVVIAAPYNPMTDKLDKANTRKGGKR